MDNYSLENKESTLLFAKRKMRELKKNFDKLEVPVAEISLKRDYQYMRMIQKSKHAILCLHFDNYIKKYVILKKLTKIEGESEESYKKRAMAETLLLQAL